MGSCLGKKKQSTPTEPANDPLKSQKTVNEKSKKTVVHEEPAAAAVEKKPVFAVVNHGARKSTGGGERKKGETPVKKKKSDEENESGGAAIPTNGGGSGAAGEGGENLVVHVVEEFKRAAPVRISSCTKEEIDAILIQCGRLSRSSSGMAATGETGAGHRRRYSGSKRSYDFDSGSKAETEEQEWGERPASRHSPQRTALSRARSGSRELGSGGGGGRKVSRSPSRRSEAPSSSGAASERSRQPAKMVSVPAREKIRGVSPVAGSNKRGSEMAALARNASPHQSRSPARITRTNNEVAPPPTIQPQSRRSSPRKAEQSPLRRNPMAEIDDNSLRSQKIRQDDQVLRKATQIQTQRAGENLAQAYNSEQKSGFDNSNSIKPNNVGVAGGGSVPEQLLNSSMTKENHKVEADQKGSEKLGARGHSRTNSFRRSSRDFDNLLNPNSYTSLLLDDIHNLQQQQNAAAVAFSLPACVSKACSILEAVADLNSASSENNNGGLLSPWYGMIRGFALQKEPFIESEVVMKDDLLEPSLHKYVTVRDLGVGDFEPQESAGSNSFVGQPWVSSPWGPTSVDSSDRYGSSKSNYGEEVEQATGFGSLDSRNEKQQQQPSVGNSRESGTRGRRTRGVSSSSNFMAPTTSSDMKRELHHRAGSGATVSSGRSGGRA